jgi:hypothetical protein
MRKILVLALSMTMLASLNGTASAWTLRVRHDRQETHARGDIRTVSSDLTAQRMFLEVGTWRRIGRNYLFVFYLDTNGSKAYDRSISLGQGGSPPGVCEVRDYSTDAIIGNVPVRRPNPRSAGCVIPRSWFSRIDRAVRFHVVSVDPPRDRAPNHGDYRWL